LTPKITLQVFQVLFIRLPVTCTLRIQRIVDTIQYATNRKNYSVINGVEKYPKDSLAIVVDWGTEDFFYNINHALH
jgi:hypothetical protein